MEYLRMFAIAVGILGIGFCLGNIFQLFKIRAELMELITIIDTTNVCPVCGSDVNGLDEDGTYGL